MPTSVVKPEAKLDAKRYIRGPSAEFGRGSLGHDFHSHMPLGFHIAISSIMVLAALRELAMHIAHIFSQPLAKDGDVSHKNEDEDGNHQNRNASSCYNALAEPLSK